MSATAQSHIALDRIEDALRSQSKGSNGMWQCPAHDDRAARLPGAAYGISEDPCSHDGFSTRPSLVARMLAFGALLIERHVA